MKKRGLEALDSLKKSGISSDNLEFHQLEVTDSSSVATLANFVKAKFGKLDILVNNAGISGAVADLDALFAAGFVSIGHQHYWHFSAVIITIIGFQLVTGVMVRFESVVLFRVLDFDLRLDHAVSCCGYISSMSTELRRVG
ncbi:hypothetical protein vseg_010859 [Gypsophila vaccaria]